jgi:hypothetical protein
MYSGWIPPEYLPYFIRQWKWAKYTTFSVSVFKIWTRLLVIEQTTLCLFNKWFIYIFQVRWLSNWRPRNFILFNVSDQCKIGSPRHSPQRARVFSFTRFLDHTQRRTTVGRSPLDECLDSCTEKDRFSGHKDLVQVDMKFTEKMANCLI